MATDPDIRTWGTRGLRTRYTPQSRLGHGMVSTAPWIDVVLLLFIFVLINSRLVLQPGVVVSLPEAPFSQGTAFGLVAVVLSVSDGATGGSKAIVFFDDERFLVGSDEQMEGLAQALAARLKEHPDAPLVLQADQSIAQGIMVEIVNLAAGVGVKQVNVAVRPK